MIIDADAHVEESQAMFDRLDKEFRDRRPLVFRVLRCVIPSTLRINGHTQECIRIRGLRKGIEKQL